MTCDVGKAEQCKRLVKMEFDRLSGEEAERLAEEAEEQGALPEEQHVPQTEQGKVPELIHLAVYGVMDAASRPPDTGDTAVNVARELIMPGGQSFEFTTFFYTFFDELREGMGMPRQSYIQSFTSVPGPNRVIGGGRSGSFVTGTHDNRYVIKTMTLGEFTLLSNILPQYKDHMLTQAGSLLTRYVGLYQIKYNKKTLLFMVMDNILGKAADMKLDEIYDLKGSYVDRQSISARTAVSNDFRGTRKDMDLRRSLCLPQRGKGLVQAQMAQDVTFLNSLGLMDYSLLVGIHNCDKQGLCCRERRKYEADVIGGWFGAFCVRVCVCVCVCVFKLINKFVL